MYIDDLDVAEKFYHQVLEMPLISKVDKRHVFFRCGESVLLCFLPEVTKNETSLPPHFAYGKQHLAFEVRKEDYLEIREKLSKKGIMFTHTQDWGNQLSSFYFEDPFGNIIGIWTRP